MNRSLFEDDEIASRMFLILMKWPIYMFKLLRRGRFATIAELRKDSYYIKQATQSRTLSRSDSRRDLKKELRMTLGSPKAAVQWAVFLTLVLVAERLVPELGSTIGALMIGVSLATILVILSSITRESTSQVDSTGDAATGSVFFSLLASGFFVASTFPFAIPWVLAFFFPRQCILFFTSWAILGAILNEVSVLVSFAREKGEPMRAESAAEARPDEPAGKRRKRKSTEQRIATLANFSLEDRKDLQEYIVSDEGLKWWAAFLAVQGTFTGVAVFLRLTVEMYLEDPYLVSFALIMSMCMFCESFWITYAAGGRWLHFKKQWKFFQPFYGGTTFVSMQLPAWMMFFTFMLVSLNDLRLPLKIAAESLDPANTLPIEWIDKSIFSYIDSVVSLMQLKSLPSGTVAIAGIAAELLMLVSLPYFEGPDDKNYLRNDEPAEVLDEVLSRICEEDESNQPQVPVDSDTTTTSSLDPSILETISISKVKRSGRSPHSKSPFAVPMWELFADIARTAWLSPIVLVIVKPEVPLFLFGFISNKFLYGASFFGLFDIYPPYLFVLMQLLYLPTFLGNPQYNGRRRWWSIRGGWVYEELSAYWYSHIIRESELRDDEYHIFGYAPHGMFPMGSMWMHNTAEWQELFPNIVPYTFVATVVHVVPMLRDVTQYNGGLDVSAHRFSSALMEYRNIMLVPGGQHEMLLPRREDVSCKHRGFIRLALKTACENRDKTINLVPLYSFGEIDMLTNAFPVSLGVQRWLVAKLRLNPAFLPVGRFNLAGVPKRVPITFVVGSPIKVPQVKGDFPTEEQVALLARRYYSALHDTFEKHKVVVEGYETSSLSFVPELEYISAQDFDKEWEELQARVEVIRNTEKPRTSPEKAPITEYVVAYMLFNICLWVPYIFF